MQKRIRLLLPIALCLFSFSLISCKDNNNPSIDSSTEYTTDSSTYSEEEHSSSTGSSMDSSSHSEEENSWSDENVDDDGWI